MEELPHLRDQYGRLKNQGFGMISIDEGDDAKTINKYATESKYTFPIAMNKSGGPNVVEMYKVQGFPTNYLLNGSGKIIARFVGFNENAMKAALQKAGFKLS
jgi:hypothetical protein